MPRYQGQSDYPPSPPESSTPPHTYPPAFDSGDYRNAPYSATSAMSSENDIAAPPLPRYTSNAPSTYSQNNINQHGSLSPLNPKSSGRNQGAHPLSNSMYANDSSPNLGDDEKRGGRRGVAKGAEKIYNRLSGYDHFSAGAGGGSSREPTQARVYRPRRAGYLDGMRFIAAWIVLNGTLFDQVLSDGSYSAIQRGSPLYISRSTNLGITFFLLLLGRALPTPLWDTPSKDNSQLPKGSIKPAISWARLTRGMLTRPFRFLLPVIVIAAIQWGLGASGKTGNCNAVGMDEPFWRLITNFKGYATLVYNLFTYYESDTVAGKTFGANLWTTAWYFQSSYAVYVIHLMLGNLSSARYWVYGILAFFSWTTFNYFYVAIIGMVMADMSIHGHFASFQNWTLAQRLIIQIVAVAVACVVQFVGPIRDHINSGLATINVQNHPEVAFCDTLFAALILFVIETSSILQFIFGNIVMRLLGRLAPGMYLLAPAITFTIVPDLALSLHNGGSSGSAILGTTWFVLFLVCVALAVPFHFAIELPSKWLGEMWANWIEKFGRPSAAPGVQGPEVAKKGGQGKSKVLV